MPHLLESLDVLYPLPMQIQVVHDLLLTVMLQRDKHTSHSPCTISLHGELTSLILQSSRILQNRTRHTATLRSYHRNAFIKTPAPNLKMITHSACYQNCCCCCCSAGQICIIVSGERGWPIQSLRRWRERRDGVMPWKKVKKYVSMYVTIIIVVNVNHCHCSRPAYRFQLAGYKDEQEYLSVNRMSAVSPHTTLPYRRVTIACPMPCLSTGGSMAPQQLCQKAAQERRLFLLL